jgi:hypothetical protein
MPASGALGPFLSAMMELRSQRLREQEMKNQATSQMLSGIGEGIGSLGKSVAGAMKEEKAAGIEAKLLQEQGITPVGGPGEIDLRAKMGQFNKTDATQAAVQARFEAGQQAQQWRWEQGQKLQKEQRDYQATRNISEDTRKYQQDALGLETNIKNALAKMADPNITPQEHGAQASYIRSQYAAAERQKLPLEEVAIPPYRTGEQQAAIRQYNQEASVGMPSAEASEEMKIVPFAPQPVLPALQGQPPQQQQPQQQQPAAQGGGFPPAGTRRTAKGKNPGDPPINVISNGKEWLQVP